jgi:steroid delta-isomerase-like uncharacterized protein
MKKYLSIAALCLCVAFVSSCNKKEGGMASEGPKVDSTMMKNKESVKKWFDAFNAHNVDNMAATMDANYIEHSPAPGQAAGIDGFKKMMTEWLAAYPDMKGTVVDVIAEGDRIGVLSRMEGTNSGPMMGMPATNKKVDVLGIDWMKISNGKVTEHWGYMDMMKWMQDLGMPMMGSDHDMKKMDEKKK